MDDKNYWIEDFTQVAYTRLFSNAQKKYKFIGYKDALKVTEDSILLRHDVDWALSRAVQLAQIEYELGIKSTYFIYPHSNGYNVLEKKSIDMIKKISRLGHDIGIHIDFELYNLYMSAKMGAENFFEYEINIFEELWDVDIVASSFHNPEHNDVLTVNNEMFCGVPNAYSESIQDKFKYCSDSNGYWRYDRLRDVLSDQYKYLHILLHPIWWTEVAMYPAERVLSFFVNEALDNYLTYSLSLEEYGRSNIGKELADAECSRIKVK